ncbi:hypothetical protein D9M73_131780 [compost metagenome]
MSAAGTPQMAPSTSGEFSSRLTNSRQLAKSLPSQRASIKAWLSSPSVTMTWAKALSMATLVPGRRAKWYSARACTESTRSMRRGSMTISRAPSRSRRLSWEANTGWASLGLAPITRITSACITESKLWVPADSPKVCFRP